MGGEFFIDFKSSNGIEISRLVQVLLNFDWFRGSPPLGGWGWVDGDGTLSRCLGRCPMHVRTCTRTHACARARERWCHKGFPRISLWGQPFAWKYHVYTCMHVCARTCVCVHVRTCVGHPPNILTESHPHPPTPTPQRGGPPESVKIQ